MKPEMKQQEEEVTLLEVSLEELYLGAVKKVAVSRMVEEKKEDRILSVEIRKGWKSGTKLIYPNEGNIQNSQPKDLILILKQKEHDRFKRIGNDLHYYEKISLRSALTSTILKIQTLDDRVLNIIVPNIITPSFTKVIKNEGMPISKSPNEKGDLVLHFIVQYPEYLNQEQKELIKQALPE